MADRSRLPGARFRDPRLNLAGQLSLRGNQTSPILADSQGFSRMAQALAGSFIQKQVLDEQEQRRQEMAQAQQAILRGATAQPFRDPDTGVVNPDQAPTGGLAGATAALSNLNTPAASGMAAQLGLQNINSQQQQQQARQAQEFALERIAAQQAGRAPPKPQTVNVGGKVRILNPDGSLGAELGNQQGFIPVPGMGVFNTTTQNFVDPQAAPQPGTGQRVPPALGQQVPPQQLNIAPPISPQSALPPAARGGAQAAELAASNVELRKGREGLAEARELARAADQFESLMKVQGTGGLRGNPVSTFVEGLVTEGTFGGDPQVVQMESLLAKITPILRGGLPGAASEKDVALFQRGGFGVGKPVQTNNAIVKGFQAAAQNAEDQQAFKERYVSQFGTLRGAEEAWKSYLEANPIFDPQSTADNPQINPDRVDFRAFFSGQQQQQSPTGFSVKRVR